jgi:hypothetical protein
MYNAKARECPQCGAASYRVPRRVIDRVLSLLSPLQRFRCTSIGCGWEGNLAVGGSVTRPKISPVVRTLTSE